MDFKTGKLHKIIREFEKGNGRYEINGIDLKNTVFLYREKAGAFIPIPKGNYKTIFNDNESILEVDDVINNKAIEFQIISVFDVQSYKYLEKYPELKMVVVQTNKIVDDINNIIGYLNSVGVKTDSKYQTQILTPLEPLSVWYMNAEGLIDTLPIDDFNKKFKEIIEKMSELADEKAQEQVKKRLDELKTEIENFKNKKISEVLKELKTEKDNSIKEIEKIKEKSKSELNSRMPEINNKFNGIAGGTINPTFIQDDGEKTEGQYYLDRPTGKLYRCIKTTSNAVNSAEYFKDMSLNSIVNRLENLITLNKVDGNFETNIGGLIIKVYSYPSKIGLNRYNFYTAFPNKCLVCILTENDGIRNTEPALEIFDKNGFKANNTIGTGQFFCTAIGY
nr:MAG TPA: hypothetical protein [Caudoviricetes sp.]